MPLRRGTRRTSAASPLTVPNRSRRRRQRPGPMATRAPARGSLTRPSRSAGSSAAAASRCNLARFSRSAASANPCSITRRAWRSRVPRSGTTFRTPCSANLRSRKPTNTSASMASSSTRRRLREPISSSVAPRGECLRPPRPVARRLDGSICRPMAATSASRSQCRQSAARSRTGSAAVAAQGAEDREPLTSKSCSTSTLSTRGASPSSKRRAAVVDMPLVDITAMSSRSAMRAAWSSGSKPSFSTNSTAA